MPVVTFKLKRARFRLNIGFALLVSAVTGGMLWAGFWQLERATQKEAIQARYQRAVQQPPVMLTPPWPSPERLRYRQVRLTGHYRPERQFLWDNRILSGNGRAEVGYHVITPFESQGRLFLVDRGWVPRGEGGHSSKPDIRAAAGRRTLVARVDRPEAGFRLGGVIVDRDWPQVIQFPDAGILAEQLGRAVYPALLVLADGQPSSYRHDWRPLVDGPARHYSYAVQWFSMSAAALILFFWFSIKRD